MGSSADKPVAASGQGNQASNKSTGGGKTPSTLSPTPQSNATSNELSHNSSSSHEIDPLFGFVEQLAQVLGDDSSTGKTSGSFTASNIASDRSGIVPSPKPSSPTSSAQLEAQKPEAEAVEGLFELLVGKPLAQVEAESAKEEVSRLHQLNTKLSDRVLQLEEQLDVSQLRRTNEELSEKLKQLEEQLLASNQQMHVLLPSLSNFLQVQTTETQKRSQSSQFSIALLGSAIALLALIFLPAGIKLYRDRQERYATSEIQRIVTTLNQIDGTSISARFDRGDVTLEGTWGKICHQ
jgi:hypothetical protein